MFRLILFFLCGAYASITVSAQTINLTGISGMTAYDLELVNDQLYVGSTGIYLLNKGKWKDVSSNLRNTLLEVTQVEHQDRYLIINTTFSGVCVAEIGKYNWVRSGHDDTSSSRDQLFDVDGQVYMINSKGVFKFDASAGEFAPLASDIPVKSFGRVVNLRQKLFLHSWSTGIWTFDIASGTWANSGELEKEYGALTNYKSDLYFRLSQFDAYKFCERDAVQWQKVNVTLGQANHTTYDSTRFNVVTEIYDSAIVNKKVWYATNRGVFQSNRNGSLTSSNNGIKAIQVKRFGTDGKTAIINLVKGISNWFYTPDQGNRWINLNESHDFPVMDANQILASKEGYHITCYSGYYFFNKKSNEIRHRLNGIEVFEIVEDKNGHLYAGAQEGIYKSKDKGNSWTKIYSTQPGFNNNVRQVALYYDSLLAVDSSRKLISSADGGESWKVLREERSKEYRMRISGDKVMWSAIGGPWQVLYQNENTFEVESFEHPTDWKTYWYFYIGEQVYRIHQDELEVAVSTDGGETFLPIAGIEPGAYKVAKHLGRVYFVYGDRIISPK